MGAWLRWPSALVTEADVKTLHSLALSITLFWGTTFTLILIVVFIPASAKLRSRALRALEADPEIADPEVWLRKSNFAMTTAQNMREIGVLLAPLLTAQISDILF